MIAGTEEPDRKILKLSDLFRRPNREKEPCLECQTLMLNINYGHNRELMKKCRRLEEYAIFVDTIRKNQVKGEDLQEAVEGAVESCIASGVLADILRAQKAEVVQMVLEGFDQEVYEKAMKKEGYEDGYQEGIKWVDMFLEGVRYSEEADFAKTSGHLSAYGRESQGLCGEVLLKLLAAVGTTLLLISALIALLLFFSVWTDMWSRKDHILNLLIPTTWILWK